MNRRTFLAISPLFLAAMLAALWFSSAQASPVTNADLRGTWFVSGACAGATDDEGDAVTCAFTCRVRIGEGNREAGNARRCQMTIRKAGLLAGAEPTYVVKHVATAEFKLRETKTAHKYASYSLQFCTEDGVCFRDFGGAQLAYPKETYKNGTNGPWFFAGGAFEMFFPNGTSCAGHWTIQFSSGAQSKN